MNSKVIKMPGGFSRVPIVISISRLDNLHEYCGDVVIDGVKFDYSITLEHGKHMQGLSIEDKIKEGYLQFFVYDKNGMKLGLGLTEKDFVYSFAHNALAKLHMYGAALRDFQVLNGKSCQLTHKSLKENLGERVISYQQQAFVNMHRDEVLPSFYDIS